jgi:hypothetical protein
LLLLAEAEVVKAAVVAAEPADIEHLPDSL